ncbi:MAG: hypothetical protein NTW59_04440, partial [Candidatus Diapherotrites archaeon]|nr:hypothetical protein [Candidatus Diapherotrites archaeon]
RKFNETLALLLGIDNKEAVTSAFRALSSRALLSEKEAGGIMAFFNEARKGLQKAANPRREKN